MKSSFIGRLLALCTLLAIAVSAQANLQIEITRGSDDPTRIAVVPFAQSGLAYDEDLASIVAADLDRSGRFAIVPRNIMLSTPSQASEVYYRDWRSLGVEYVLIGSAEKTAENIVLEYELFEVHSQRSLLKQRVTQPMPGERSLAHTVSDAVYEKLTGIPGVFNTRMAYVSVTGTVHTGQVYRLYIADADGARPKEVLKSNEPVLSPAWSPDGSKIAYVSFESKRPAIYLQDLKTGSRTRLTSFRGLNGAPAWSPDGKRLALVLSKDGNPEIYVLELASGQLTQITNHPAIDTEPDWMPDGRSLVFTSDRGGRPQIYQQEIASGKIRRLTYEGTYNAAAQVLADGKSMIMVHGQHGDFHIAWQEIETGRIIVLTRSSLDESPSIAPNGSMLLYATKYRGKGVLAAVALDGGFKYRLPSPNSDVREPAWSPW